jgi:hypothetical protein
VSEQYIDSIMHGATIEVKKGYFTLKIYLHFFSTLHVTCEILIRAKIFVMAVSNKNGARI